MTLREMHFTNPPDPGAYPFNCAPGWAPHGVMDWQAPQTDASEAGIYSTEAEIDVMICEVAAAIRAVGPRTEVVGRYIGLTRKASDDPA